MWPKDNSNLFRDNRRLRPPFCFLSVPWPLADDIHLNGGTLSVVKMSTTFQCRGKLEKKGYLHVRRALGWRPPRRWYRRPEEKLRRAATAAPACHWSAIEIRKCAARAPPAGSVDGRCICPAP